MSQVAIIICSLPIHNSVSISNFSLFK